MLIASGPTHTTRRSAGHHCDKPSFKDQWEYVNTAFAGVHGNATIEFTEVLVVMKIPAT
jgi:hypothetical protein